MATKPISDTKLLTADQVKLLIEVHKRANVTLTAAQWEDLAPAISAKNGKAAKERFRYLMSQLQSSSPSKTDKAATTPESTPGKRKADVNITATPSKKRRVEKIAASNLKENPVTPAKNQPTVVGNEDQDEVKFENTSSVSSYDGIGEYTSMMLTAGERRELEEGIHEDELDGLFGSNIGF